MVNLQGESKTEVAEDEVHLSRIKDSKIKVSRHKETYVVREV